MWQKKYEDIEGYFHDFLRQRKITFEVSLSDFVKEKTTSDEFDETVFKQGIEKRLNLGSFSLFVVVDKGNQELKDIANYLNDRTNQEIDFYLIEVEQIGDEGEMFLTPRLLNPPRKTINTVSSQSDKYDRTPISKDHFIMRTSKSGKRLTDRLFGELGSFPGINTKWGKNGFSLSTVVPEDIYKNVTDYVPRYSYFFFQVGRPEEPTKDLLTFWYPESSYKELPKLKPIVEKYRNFYQSIQGYDDKDDICDISVFTEEKITQFIELIKEVANKLNIRV